MEAAWGQAGRRLRYGGRGLAGGLREEEAAAAPAARVGAGPARGDLAGPEAAG